MLSRARGAWSTGARTPTRISSATLRCSSGQPTWLAHNLEGALRWRCIIGAESLVRDGQTTGQRRWASSAAEGAGERGREAESGGDRGDGGDGGDGGRMEAGLFTGMVESPSAQTSIDDLIAHISPQRNAPHLAPSRPNSWPSQLVLLLTPRYAQHALAADLPTRVLQRFRPNLNPTVSKPLDAITAVVDRLPFPDSTNPLNTAGVGSTGGEGLAYLFMTHPPPLSTSSQTPLQPEAQKPGSLTFGMSSIHYKTSAIALRNSVQLPLAHTIFSNGLPSTLVHTRYHFDPLTGNLRKSESHSLESQEIRLPPTRGLESVALDTNLVPLTPARPVRTWMGNIIRTLSPKMFRDEMKKPINRTSGPDATSADSLPASQELEEAVSRYFEENSLTPQPVQVWALIIPRKHFRYSRDRKRILTFEPGVKIDGELRELRLGVSHFLRDGARMHRVLSGGGGWGKKAGLLSLDPDVEYSTRNLRDEKGWQFDFDGTDPESAIQRHQKEALGDIIHPGDGVMFFLPSKNPVTPSLNDATAPPDSPSSPEPNTSPKPFLSLLFGPIPSTIDDIPMWTAGAHSTQRENGSQPKHFAHTFGAFSEGGMAFQSFDFGDSMTKTKIDVPFSRFELTSIEKPVEAEKPITGGPISSISQQLSGEENAPYQQASERPLTQRKSVIRKITQPILRYTNDGPYRPPRAHTEHSDGMDGSHQDSVLAQRATRSGPGKRSYGK